MIGDIDLLVKDSEIESQITNKIGYQGKIKYKLWRTKHQPRLINSKKIFALRFTLKFYYLDRQNKLLKYLNDKN